MRRLYHQGEKPEERPPTLKEKKYPPTPEEYAEAVWRFRIMPKQRREFGLTEIERNWN